MRLAISRSKEAERDLEEQAVYIAGDRPSAAAAFLHAANRAFELLAELPQAGSPRRFRNTSLDGMRTWSIRGFEKHTIFYRTTPGQIEVVRVLHGARDAERIFGVKS